MRMNPCLLVRSIYKLNLKAETQKKTKNKQTKKPQKFKGGNTSQLFMSQHYADIKKLRYNK